MATIMAPDYTDPGTTDLAAFPAIGTGLWGSVHDLGDGSVVKLARRRCAGIGDGLEKMRREEAVLQALGACTLDAALSVPRPIAAGQRDHPDTPLWLQVTKVPGAVRKVAEVERLPEQERRAVAASIGRAAASIHRLLSSAALAGILPSAGERFDHLAQGLHGDAEAQGYLSRLRQVYRSFGVPGLPVIHGDLNISNLLFEGHCVVSVVDFAETRRGFYEEDLASILFELPDLRGPLVEEYQALSGSEMDGEKIEFALAMEHLGTLVISRRLGLAAESEAAHQRLDAYLGRGRFKAGFTAAGAVERSS